jgi:hypothetical protein
MKVSDFVDEIEDCLDEDLRQFGGGDGEGTLYDHYAHYYDKRGGTPYLIINAEHAGTKHGMEMKSAYKQFELLECSVQEIYVAMVRDRVMQRIVEIEKSMGTAGEWMNQFDGTAEKLVQQECDKTEEEERQAFLRDNT